jgi:hypothetical protein
MRSSCSFLADAQHLLCLSCCVPLVESTRCSCWVFCRYNNLSTTPIDRQGTNELRSSKPACLTGYNNMAGKHNRCGARASRLPVAADSITSSHTKTSFWPLLPRLTSYELALNRPVLAILPRLFLSAHRVKSHVLHIRRLVSADVYSGAAEAALPSLARLPKHSDRMSAVLHIVQPGTVLYCSVALSHICLSARFCAPCCILCCSSAATFE